MRLDTLNSTKSPVWRRSELRDSERQLNLVKKIES
jgi:hypothetical protein